MAGSERITRQRSHKHFWFALHGWMALPIWGLLAFICVTGTICVVSEEINWLLTPESRAENPHQTEPLPYDTLIAVVKKSYPEAAIQSIHITQPYLATLIRISLPDDRKALYVNQFTGEVQGEVKGTGFRGFIIALHGWLLFPWQNDYSLGWYLVTVLSIPLLGSVISGLIIFKHFYRVLYRPTLRLNMGSRVFWGDLHRLIAVWSIWFVIVISVSSLWFLAQGILTQNHVEIYPEKNRLSADLIPETSNNRLPERMSADQASAIAKTIYPGLYVTFIEFPKNEDDTLLIQGTTVFSLFRDNANAINLNPYNGDVISVRGTKNLSLIQFISALLTPLHFGDFAGLTVKLIWFSFGCLVSTLVCSGFIIWTKRTVISLKSASRLHKFNGDSTH
ncbi:MAG: PepSY domain-containing protein, partial [Sphingobacteriales bacterium]